MVVGVCQEILRCVVGCCIARLDLRENVSWRGTGTDAHLPQPVSIIANHIHLCRSFVSGDSSWIAARLCVFVAELSLALLSKLHCVQLAGLQQSWQFLLVAAIGSLLLSHDNSSCGG